MKTIAHSSRSLSVVCSASSNKNPKFEKPKKIFKEFHDKRNETFKLNSNDLVRVSQAEINEIGAFMKELDTFHKQQFDELKENLKNKNKDTNKKTTEGVEDVEDVPEVVAEVVDDDENIFLKK
jgi:hypothetical protein